MLPCFRPIPWNLFLSNQLMGPTIDTVNFFAQLAKIRLRKLESKGSTPQRPSGYQLIFCNLNDDCQPCAVFETIEDCRKFDLDLSLTENTFWHFKDWGQKEHYERRRMHSLRAIRQLTKTWGERRIPSYFKYEYYGLLV